MTDKDILNTALKQSAIDLSCNADDFFTAENKVVISKPSPEARRYLDLPFFCNLVSYGTNIVASVDERIYNFMLNYINHGKIENCFATPNIYLLTDEFKKYGKSPCFMAEYFLPDLSVFKVLPCDYPVKILHPCDFADMYTEQWGNALCSKRKHLDMLVAAAFDGDKFIGMAGASADCEAMWQIGVDVLPDYRRKGIASALTSRLAHEVFALGRVPFYCAAWSNIKSVKNAIKSGFRPAWAELTSIDTDKALKLAE